MIQARVNVFETNSSSTHNCTIMDDKDYQRFVNGELYINDGYISSNSEFKDECYVTKEQIVDILEKSDNKKCQEIAAKLRQHITDDDNSFDDCLDSNDLTYPFISYSQFGGDLYVDEHTFVTEHNDTVHVLCEYGYDG